MRFPFSDLSGNKVRPAVIVAVLDRGDVVACQITSNGAIRRDLLALHPSSFLQGLLPVASFVLAGKIFTAHDSIVTKVVAKLTDAVRDQIREAVGKIVSGK
jgi:mRNA interferase MazF